MDLNGRSLTDTRIPFSEIVQGGHLVLEMGNQPKDDMKTKSTNSAIFPILFGFFVMGFVDVVGIATNYVKMDFGLSDTLANLLPMMVFLWFALFSVPTGIWMGRHGRRNTVVAALAITTLAMLIPLFFYDFACILFAFALLGIGNTILQVSLNPMVARW